MQFFYDTFREAPWAGYDRRDERGKMRKRREAGKGKTICVNDNNTTEIVQLRIHCDKVPDERQRMENDEHQLQDGVGHHLCPEMS